MVSAEGWDDPHFVGEKAEAKGLLDLCSRWVLSGTKGGTGIHGISLGAAGTFLYSEGDGEMGWSWATTMDWIRTRPRSLRACLRDEPTYKGVTELKVQTDPPRIEVSLPQSCLVWSR